jgi:uncharacterized surface protein with fasciclin (FAS1) repeats
MFSKLNRRGGVVVAIAAMSLASAGVAAATAPPDSEPMTSEPMTSEPMTGGPSGAACAAVPNEGEGSVGGMADDPVGTAASNNPLLTTLVAAVDAAGLVDTLNTGGPYTIFAPINTAFAKIPADTLNGVLADTDALTGILTYHVIPEQLSGADLVAGGTFATVNGAELSVAQSGETLVINDGASAVLCADVPTANATVFLIDTVLMPPA